MNSIQFTQLANEFVMSCKSHLWKNFFNELALRSIKAEKWMKENSGRNNEENKIDECHEKPLIDHPDGICPFYDRTEVFIISNDIKNIYDIFHDGFWAYMAQEDKDFSDYCCKRIPYRQDGKKMYTYVQPYRAVHYLLAKGTTVTQNRIKKYFKITCKINAQHESAVAV